MFLIFVVHILLQLMMFAIMVAWVVIPGFIFGTGVYNWWRRR